jgi:hypothetical protein
MSAAALFLPGDGDLFIPVSIRLAALSKGRILSAHLVYQALIDCLRPGMTETSEAVTDRFLQNNSPWLRGYSVSFIQKGLRTLEELGIIERHPRHGRRRIVFKVRLRGRAQAPPRPSTASRSRADAKDSVPNVGTIPDTTPEQIAAAQAAIALTLVEPPEPSAQERAAAEEFLAASRARRAEQAARDAARARRSTDRTGMTRPQIHAQLDSLNARLARAQGDHAPAPDDPATRSGP